MSIADALNISCCISFTNRIFEGNPRQETGRNWIPWWSLDEALFHPNSRCHSSSLNVYPTQSSSADINRCLRKVCWLRRLVPWNQQLQRIHWNPHFPRCYIKIALIYCYEFMMRTPGQPVYYTLRYAADVHWRKLLGSWALKYPKQPTIVDSSARLVAIFLLMLAPF